MSILTSEVKDLMSQEHALYDVAESIEYKRDLNAEQKDAAQVMDAWAKNIGETGKDPECDIAATSRELYSLKYIMHPTNF